MQQLKIGDKIYFEEEVRPYRVRAASERYAVMTKPFNPKKTVLYTILDTEKMFRGPEDLVFGFGAETDSQCDAMLKRVIRGETAISIRHGIIANIQRIDVWGKKKNISRE